MNPLLVAAFSGGAQGELGFDLASYVISTSAPNPTNGLGGLVINSDGTIDRLEYDSTTTLAGTWGDPAGVYNIADYDFQCEKTSGVSLDGPNAENTWHAGVDGIQFSNARTTNGTDIGTFILHIRPTGGGADIDTATFTLTVIKESP